VEEDVMTTMTFVMVDHSNGGSVQDGSALTASVLAAISEVIAKQLNDEFAQEWGGTYASRVGASNGSDVQQDKGEIEVAIFQNEDVSGAAGYHDRDPQGHAYIHIALDDASSLTTASEGLPLSVIISHECCETAADPGANRWADRTGTVEEAIETCLAPETEIVLANGSLVPIHILSDRGGFFDVHTSVGVSRAGHARRTMRDAATVCVKFTDGTNVRCTPNHKFLTADGRFLAADLLMPSTRLHPFVEMSPSVSVTRPLDRSDSYSKSSGSIFAGLKSLPQSDHFRLSKSRMTRVLSELIPIASHAPLTRGVEHVGPMRTDEEMVGSYASSDVAGVTHLHATRNFAAMHREREAMGELRLAFESELSVSRAATGTDPEPAPISFSHLRPEPFLKRGRAAIVGSVSSIKRPMAPHSGPMNTAHAARQYRTDASFGDAGGLTHAKVVHSVEPAANADVYDLTVPGARHFAIGAGVFVHNCDRVEDTFYAIDGVAVSNFLLKSAFDPGSCGPWDHMNVLLTEDGQTDGGYVIERQQGTETTTGAKELTIKIGRRVSARHGSVTKAFKRRKNHPASRTSRRGAKIK
jgi:hypothetical protein